MGSENNRTSRGATGKTFQKKPGNESQRRRALSVKWRSFPSSSFRPSEIFQISAIFGGRAYPIPPKGRDTALQLAKMPPPQRLPRRAVTGAVRSVGGGGGTNLCDKRVGSSRGRGGGIERLAGTAVLPDTPPPPRVPGALQTGTGNPWRRPTGDGERGAKGDGGPPLLHIDTGYYTRGGKWRRAESVVRKK